MHIYFECDISARIRAFWHSFRNLAGKSRFHFHGTEQNKKYKQQQTQFRLSLDQTDHNLNWLLIFLACIQGQQLPFYKQSDGDVHHSSGDVGGGDAVGSPDPSRLCVEGGLSLLTLPLIIYWLTFISTKEVTINWCTK